MLAKNTTLLTLASIGQKLIAFVYFLFVARVMMPHATGIFFLATSFILLFSVTTDFGLTPVIIREVAKHPVGILPTLRSAWIYKLLCDVVSVVCVLLTAQVLYRDPLTRQMISLTTLVMVVDSWHLLLYGMLRGQQRLQFEALGMCMGQILTVLFGAFVLIFFPSLPLLLFALLCGSVTNVLISSSVLIRQFGWSLLLPHWNRGILKRLLHLSIPFALIAIFTKISTSIDTIFISKFLPIAAVGLYGVAFKLTYAFQFLPLSFSAALYPQLSAVIEQDEKAAEHIFQRAVWYVLLMATPIALGLWLIASEIVTVVGSAYEGAAPILRLLVFVLFPVFLDFPFGALLNAAHRQQMRLAIVAIGMCVNVILNMILIPRFGLIGAAISALSSSMTILVLDVCVLKKIFPYFSFCSSLIKIAPLFLSGAVMTFFGVLLKPLTGWIGMIPCAVMIYGVSLILTGALTSDEVKKMLFLFRKASV